MKTILSLVFAGLIAPAAVAQVEDTAKNVAHSTAEGAKKAAKTVAHGVKKAVEKVEDVLTPEADAHRVEVTVTDDKVDMPASLRPGKTAFVIKNNGKSPQNFELEGSDVDREFMNPPKPGETKVLHVTLERGTYKAYLPDANGEKGTAKATVRVK
jgi:hypothetical protein